MMNAGDTGFILICTAFVFFMTPGLAFFYGGLVRRKNVVNTIMACGAIMGLSVVMWTLFGYSLAFGGNHGGIIGDFRWFALNGVGWEPGPYADTIPHLVFVAFQMMFAMITPALITGAVVGRMRFKALFFFIAIWSLIVYYPMAHMVWETVDFWQPLALWTLQEEMWYISVPVSVHWFLPFILDRDEAMQKQPIVRTISRLYFSGQPCCGSDGSALMQEVR